MANYVLGTGNFGILVDLILEENGIFIDGFIDINPNSKIKQHNNKKVINVKEVKGKDNLYIGTNRYNHDWILKVYGSYGNIKFIDEFLANKSLINFNLVEGLSWSLEKAEDEIKSYATIRQHCSKEFKEGKDSLILNCLDVVVTERCTLKCANCSNLMQYYTKPQNTEGSDLISQLCLILSSTKVNSIRLIGGEPLIHKDLGRLVEKICNKWRNSFQSIEIYTNGTLLPKEDLINISKNNPVTFYISDYGSYSRRKDELLDILKKNNIRYALETDLNWQDCGRVLPYSDERIEYKYANCCVSKTISLLNGKIYSCPFSANFHNLYKGESIKRRDFIDITNISKEELTQRLREMQGDSSPLSACYYCNGRDYTVGNVEVAEQTKVILKR